uniref:Putative nuclear shuttle protein n=1 Tax=Grapevine-associated nanovirus TaxID=2768783 RepID=A0A7S6SML0_9VIRU|nr:nuclear shuttle protein [Grapevine-associated nanovirus]
MDLMGALLKCSNQEFDFPSISQNGNENRRDFNVSEAGSYSSARRVILNKVRISANGSFYGSNRNVRGFINLFMKTDDGEYKILTSVPIGGYLYRDDWGYFQGYQEIDINTISGVIEPRDDYSKLFRIQIEDKHGMCDQCDVFIKVNFILRVQIS